MTFSTPDRDSLTILEYIYDKRVSNEQLNLNINLIHLDLSSKRCIIQQLGSLCFGFSFKKNGPRFSLCFHFYWLCIGSGSNNSGIGFGLWNRLMMTIIKFSTFALSIMALFFASTSVRNLMASPSALIRATSESRFIWAVAISVWPARLLNWVSVWAVVKACLEILEES